MDAAGIGRVLVSQCKRWSCERQWMCVDTRLDDVVRYTAASPRFIGLAGYNPFDIAESLREIELAVTTHAFRGVYMHAGPEIGVASTKTFTATITASYAAGSTSSTARTVAPGAIGSTVAAQRAPRSRARRLPILPKPTTR